MIDHRPAQTPVRHQGDRPTCVAFAISAAHEWHAADGVVRSSEDAMWAAHQVDEVPGREETTVSWALEGLDRHQHSTEAAWPYGVPPWASGRPAAALDSANRRPLPVWRDLGAASFDAVTGELDGGRPVMLTLRVVAAAWYHAGDLVDAEANLKTRATTPSSPSAPSTPPTGSSSRTPGGPHGATPATATSPADTTTATRCARTPWRHHDDHRRPLHRRHELVRGLA